LLSDQLQEIFRGGRREEWLRLLREKDVPCAPLNTLEEVFNDPQVQAYGFPVELEHHRMGKMRLVGSGIELSATPPEINIAPPTLGEHTSEVLESLGYDELALGRLRKAGVI
jgi:crotonobetainyl-CoA:carnitine CoA-transferase CaiB-like acyl-CoA transferase